MTNIILNMKKINERYHIGLIFFVFTFLFAPPIIPNINFVFINFIFSIIMIIKKYRNNLKQFIINKKINNVLRLLILYIILFVVSIVTNAVANSQWYINNYIINFYSLFLAFPVVWICAMYIIFRAEELKIGFKDIIKIFIIAGLIQVIFCILSLISPTVKKALIDMMYNNTGEKLLLSPWVTSRRFYGFANNLLDLFGFGTGMLCVLPLYKIVDNNKKYILAIPLLLMMPFLNSRTGLVIFAIGVIVFLIYILLTDKEKAQIFIKYFMILVMLGVIGIFVIQIFSPNTIDWISKDFKSFVSSDETDEVRYSRYSF